MNNDLLSRNPISRFRLRLRLDNALGVGEERRCGVKHICENCRRKDKYCPVVGIVSDYAISCIHKLTVNVQERRLLMNDKIIDMPTPDPGGEDALSIRDKCVMDTGGEELVFLDDLDDCIAGIVSQAGRPPIVCYDYNKVIAKLVVDCEMTETDAIKYFEFNIIGSFLGDHTPCFIDRSCLE